MIFLIAKIIDGVFGLLELAIIIECISSWIPQMRYSSFMEIIYIITSPILEPFRALQDRLIQGLPVDFSPVIAIVVIGFVRNVLIRLVYMLL